MKRTYTHSAIAVLALALAVLVWSCGDDDDNNGTGSSNRPPVISALTANPDSMPQGNITTITVTASDPDGDDLDYLWEARDTWLTSIGAVLNSVEMHNCCPITPPDSTWVISTVDDGHGGEARDSIMIWITQ